MADDNKQEKEEQTPPTPPSEETVEIVLPGELRLIKGSEPGQSSPDQE